MTKSHNRAALDKIRKVVDKIEELGLDITNDYVHWRMCGLALKKYGEYGRELFHTLSSVYKDYDLDETNQHFSRMLSTDTRFVADDYIITAGRNEYVKTRKSHA